MSLHDLAARVVTGTTYHARPYPATTVPTGFERHVLNRLGCGYSRTTWRQMRFLGGPQQWLERQLDPGSLRESATADAALSWFPRLSDTPAQRWAHNVDASFAAWEYARDHGNWTALRRMYSTRQVLETMVDFWNNHLHVPLNANHSWAARWDYDTTIREHALGKFEDLLVACALHPSMLLFLDNAKSVRGVPNENQGRELLELHTVGRTAGYTEEMVKHSARILSGWTVDDNGHSTWTAYYDPARHTRGAVDVLGFTDANDTDDAELATRYLRYLAHHPATAVMVARRLAVRFVSDDPSQGLVDHLAAVFTDSGTDIAATLRALAATDEFAASAGAKVRTPVDDLVATVRVLGVAASAPKDGKSFANAIAWMPRSTLLYQWPRPDGAPETNDEWASVSRVLASFRMHWLLAGGYYPDTGVRYKPPRSWLPRSGVRLDQYVDHTCRMLLGRPSTSLDLKAVCQATGHGPAEKVTARHPLASWMFVRMAIVLLDSPDHMSR